MDNGPVAHKMIGGGHMAGKSREQRKPKRKSVRSISIERSANGGHVISHAFHQSGEGPYQESEQHTFGKGEHDQVMEHLKKHLGFNRAEGAAKARAASDEEAGEPAGADDEADEE